VLHAIAERNAAIVRGAGALVSPVSLVHADATRYEPPAGPLIVFLYHPFRDPVAAEVMARLNASLAASPRPAAILYGHPTLQSPIAPDVFAVDGVFTNTVVGERATRSFRIGWSVWSNDAWLRGARVAAPALARTAG
jgi:hypothetical protein